MRRWHTLLACCCLVFFQATAHAGIIGMASDSFLTSYACRMTHTGRCTVALSSDFPGAEEGDKYRTASGVISSASNRYTSAQAVAAFQPDRLLPVLKTYASTTGHQPPLANIDPSRFTGETGMISDANVWFVSRYRYIGFAPTELLLTAAADTQFSPSSLIGHSHMQLGIFTASDYRFDVDGFCPIFLRSELSGCSSDATRLANAGMFLNPLVFVNTLTISYHVKPGDEFYVGGYLDANVCCGGTVDTMHTMNMLFSDTSMLEMLPVPGAGIAAIPEPTSHLLLMGGLLALGAARRRRRSH